MNKKRLQKTLMNLDVTITVICLTVIILVTFVGVIMRYIVGKPFTWQEEVQKWMIVWIAFLGGGYAFREKSHIAIDIIVDAFPKKVQNIVEIATHFVAILLLLYLMYNGGAMMMQYLNTGRVTSVLHIPSALIYSAVPIGCADMVLSILYSLYQDIWGKKTMTEEVNSDGD